MARQRIQLEITGDSRSVERAFGRANKAAGGFGSTIKKLGKIAAVGVGAAFVGLGLALRRGFKEFMEAQKVMAQSRAVIKSTGGVANVTAKHIDSLAGALSRMSGVDDEAIASGANMLLTFTNIRNAAGRGNKVFDAATKTILDMSVALGRELPDVAIMVGKALNDLEVNAKGTITGWSALRRVGVKVSSDMMKQAVAFIRAGKPMKAQQLLLRELNTEFGGSARAFGGTLPGAFAKLKNAVDEVLGSFAEGLAPVVQRVANLLANKMANPAFVARVRELGQLVGNKLVNAFTAVGQWFDAHWGEITTGVRNFVRIMRTALRVAGQLKTVLLTITAPLRAQFRVLMEIWDKVLGAISTGAGILSHVPGVGGKFKNVQQAIDAAREVMRDPMGGGTGKGRNKRGIGRAPRTHAEYVQQVAGRASGGPVLSGASYLVGERGPELLTMGSSSGYITPNGGGRGGGTVVIQIGGKELGRFALDDLQRLAKGDGGQTRGRWGGQRLALS